MGKSFVRLATVRPRKRNAKPDTALALEKPTQRSILQWLAVVLPAGSMVSASMNEAAAGSSDEHARARFYAARKASGVLTGFPDLTIALPAGRVVFLEAKRPKGGILSVAQQDRHAELRQLGHVVGVASSIETARFVLQAAGVPLREAAGQLALPAVFGLAKRPPSIDGALPF